MNTLFSKDMDPLMDPQESVAARNLRARLDRQFAFTRGSTLRAMVPTLAGLFYQDVAAQSLQLLHEGRTLIGEFQLVQSLRGLDRDRLKTMGITVVADSHVRFYGSQHPIPDVILLPANHTDLHPDRMFEVKLDPGRIRPHREVQYAPIHPKIPKGYVDFYRLFGASKFRMAISSALQNLGIHYEPGTAQIEEPNDDMYTKVTTAPEPTVELQTRPGRILLPVTREYVVHQTREVVTRYINELSNRREQRYLNSLH